MSDKTITLGCDGTQKGLKDLGGGVYGDKVAVYDGDLAAAIAAELAGATQAYGDTQTITRPDNTTAYTAGDVIGAATDATAAKEFTVGPTGGGEVIITSASLMIGLDAVPSGMGAFRLHLYSVTPPSALADNVSWDLPAGDRGSYLGFIDLSTPLDVGSTIYVQTDRINKQIRLVGATVFGYLQTVGAYTPASQTVHTITLHTVRV